MVTQHVVCPIHGTGDNIQRISGVVSGGQAHGTFSGPTGSVVNVDGKWGAAGGYTTLSGSTISNLAASLTPPREPKKRAFGWLATIFMYYLFGSWIVMGVAIAMTPTWLLVSSPQGWISVLGIVGVALCLTFLFIGLGALGFRWYINKNKQVQLEYPAKKRAWDQAMARWNRSYYCFRDDVVFDPDNGESCRPQDLNQFLYAHT